MERVEKAVEYKHSGCNCCQAVLMAFEDELELGGEQLKALGSGFGGGMGCMEATCGALVGANMVLGMKNETGKPTTPQSRQLLNDFEAACGATICKELKGIGTGKVLCECDDCVRNAVRALLK
ncbi:C_GCAxxG_C_C family probable redox protein [Lachnospiraceae bacterium JC7]|nr:C_GCAxxG_C_C family probable redox protein [Lachnospiraceae bacterium JC7]